MRLGAANDVLELVPSWGVERGVGRRGVNIIKEGVSHLGGDLIIDWAT